MDATLPTSASNQDGVFLHFLKELPSWVVIGIFVAAFLGVWQYSHDDFIPRILDGLIGALLTSIVTNRAKSPTITAGTIQTGDVSSGKSDTEEEDK